MVEMVECLPTLLLPSQSYIKVLIFHELFLGSFSNHTLEDLSYCMPHKYLGSVFAYVIVPR